ncbi:hypothetical protein L6452_36703 [Arctium lappa]|uniref:Uncharacterized protein n=1 Tax=Arctium lappa TaxID=4217 RepID=A0ACB8Y977_ARCLA|nr:hypothetical protein L6452_36703 [Arctium lappa]
MAKSVSPEAISMIMSNPTPDSSAVHPEIVVQVLDIKYAGNRYTLDFSHFKLMVANTLVLLCTKSLEAVVLGQKLYHQFQWQERK